MASRRGAVRPPTVFVHAAYKRFADRFLDGTSAWNGPLGVVSDAAYRTFEFTAEPDSMLVLYTDGLIEYDRDVIEGERLMLATAREIAVRRLANPAAEIQDAIFAGREPSDDVAILTISFRDRADIPEGDIGEQWSVALRGVRASFAKP